MIHESPITITTHMRQQFMCKTTNSKQSGTSMVEVLVALVVMSIGMLGIAGLYATTLQAKTTSLSRMKAVNLAYDMADRIRANPTAAADYVLTASDTTTATNCATVNCTAAQMAASDLDQWDNLVTDPITGLPGSASGSIARTQATANTPEFFTITLNWSEPNSGALSYVLQVRI